MNKTINNTLDILINYYFMTFVKNVYIRLILPQNK